jgi:uncharacterized protein YkwD
VRSLLLSATVVLAAVPLGCGSESSTSRSAGSVAIGKAEQARVVPPPAGTGGRRAPGRIIRTAPRPGPSDRGPAPFGSHQPSCSGTDAEPAAGNLAAVTGATLCLLNVERTSRGLRALQSNARLARAALTHSRDMVAHAYFGHDSQNGDNFTVRIRRVGYFRGARRWLAGENLAWGTGAFATPAELVRAWMASPPHRANILTAGFREIGIGFTLGTPRSGEGGATVSSDFGTRT